MFCFVCTNLEKDVVCNMWHITLLIKHDQNFRGFLADVRLKVLGNIAVE